MWDERATDGGEGSWMAEKCVSSLVASDERPSMGL
jgi:hypothetical protein